MSAIYSLQTLDYLFASKILVSEFTKEIVNIYQVENRFF